MRVDGCESFLTMTKTKAGAKLPRKVLETDLYEPLRDFLKRCGYKVRAEVLSCDIVAVKDKQVVVVEQKLRLNLELLAQAAQRQKITDSV